MDTQNLLTPEQIAAILARNPGSKDVLALVRHIDALNAQGARLLNSILPALSDPRRGILRNGAGEPREAA